MELFAIVGFIALLCIFGWRALLFAGLVMGVIVFAFGRMSYLDTLQRQAEATQLQAECIARSPTNDTDRFLCEPYLRKPARQVGDAADVGD